MLSWKQQGPAFIAAVVLDGGETATVAVLADAANVAGIALIRKGEDGAPVTQQLPDAMPLLRPADLVEIYCMQERAFGNRGLPKPTV